MAEQERDVKEALKEAKDRGLVKVSLEETTWAVRTPIPCHALPFQHQFYPRILVHHRGRISTAIEDRFHPGFEYSYLASYGSGIL